MCYYIAGLNENAQAHIKSMRMLTDNMDIFTCKPHNDLLSSRSENEAYAIVNPGKEYAVYFPDGGTVDLDVSAAQDSLKARWLDISQSRWANGRGTGGSRCNQPLSARTRSLGGAHQPLI